MGLVYDTLYLFNSNCPRYGNAVTNQLFTELRDVSEEGLDIEHVSPVEEIVFVSVLL